MATETTWGATWGSIWGGSPPTIHLDDALAILFEQFENAPNINAVVEWIFDGFQVLEEQTYLIRWYMYVDTAAGQQLEDLADLVGLNIGGLTTDQARAAIKARGPALRQRRTPELFLRVLSALNANGEAGSYEYAEWHPLTVEITLTDIDGVTAAWWNVVIRAAKAHGIRLIITVVEDDSTAFKWDTASPNCWDEGKWAYSLDS